jgi:hypothetical protein
MAKRTREYSAFFEGIADFSKTGGPAAYQKGRSVDHRTDTRSVQLLPRTLKESGTVVTDLIKWSVTPSSTCNSTFMYGEDGNFYQRDSNASYSVLRTIANSHGNGLGWFGEDNFIYYTSDSLIGRYGPVCSSTATFNDNFFGSQGGNRTNTNSLELLSASTQYASRASTSSLQVAGNLSIAAKIYPYTLPATGETQTFVSKWTENGNLRSYKFDISPVSNYFGDGSDGALTVSVNTTEAPIDSACTGTTGTRTLTATNVNFAANQIILIHQTQGTGAGTWQRNTIQSYTAGTITTVDALNATYTTGAQVRVLKQYTNVTINSGITYTAKAWNGTVGGILAFLANGTVTVTGSINANGQAASGSTGGAGIGFRGGNSSGSTYGWTGEGTSGASFFEGPPSYPVASWNAANGSGGGAGGSNGDGGEGGAGGGGNGTAGSDGKVGVDGLNSVQGRGGSSSGTEDLTTMTFGGGGGGCSQTGAGAGGGGGGIIGVFGVTVTITGSIVANGAAGQNATGGNCAGGGGAGGSILIKAQTATLGSALITATGGTGGLNGSSVKYGGDGGSGRIHLDYYTSYTGTTSPTLDVTQDNNLGSSNGHVLRLQVSSNGTNSETYSRPVTLTLNQWQQVCVAWTALSSSATFYLNGVLLGTSTGALTSISANASVFNVGTYLNGSSTASGLYNGLIDEVQVFNIVRTESDCLNSLDSEILTTTTGLQAYYMFNAAATDSTANANTLTLTGSPSYSTNVPFLGSSTRLDIDQSQTLSGNTYTIPSAIAETAANKMVFAPTKDPVRSISIKVGTVGTGDWTMTVHDSFDSIVATKTFTNAQMSTGYMEFIFSTPWRPLINANYHFHLTSSDGTGTVVTGTASDLSTVSYREYFAFLIEDTKYHPVSNMLQFLVFGNERYVGTLEATLYDPNAITLPAGYKVRCFGYWNEYLAIGTWRGSTIDQYDQGRIFFWDGISSTYNFFIDVPEGGINAMIGTRGRLYFIAGSRAKLLVYEGGAQARKIKNLINTENTAVVDVYPGAISMWRTLMRIGVAGNNQDTDVQQGVYTWGSVNDKYPDSLSFDFPISTGTYTGTTVRIGCVTTVDGKLLIGWKDNTACGVDSITISNNVYPTGTVEFLIEDEDAMYHQKEAVTVTAQFEPLISGQSVGLKYRLDRNSSWTEYTSITTVGATTDRHVISFRGSRYREYEIGVNLATSVSTSPTVLGVSLEVEALESEKRVG